MLSGFSILDPREAGRGRRLSDSRPGGRPRAGEGRRYPSPMTWQDFWSTTLPAYLGALGSIAASTVAVAAFIRDLRTRRGLKEVAESSASSVAILPSGASHAESMPSIAPGPAAEDVGGVPAEEPRLLLTTRGKLTVLRNAGPEPISIAHVSIPSGGKRLVLSDPLPARIEPGEGFSFVVEERMGGAAVAALQVRWTDGRGVSRLSRFFV